MLTTGEWLIVIAGVLLAVSLPFLAAGSYVLWIMAQAIYFIGLGVAVTYFLAQRRV
jgi:hypothetical protein